MLDVGVDLDGVCYDFGKSLRDYLTIREDFPRVVLGRSAVLSEDERRKYVASLPACDAWDFYKAWGLTDAQFTELVNDGVNAGYIFRVGEPHPGTQEMFRRLKQMGCRIHIITDRSFGDPGKAKENTKAWLAEYGLAYDTIHFTAHKTDVIVDTMIDDKPENYEAFLWNTQAEIYLLDRPWNRSLRTRPGERLHSLWEYVQKIEDRMDRQWQHTEDLAEKVQFQAEHELAWEPVLDEESVLGEADRIVSTDRGSDYGHPLDDFSKTAKMWSAIFGVEIEPEQVALAMVCVKISRLLNKYKRDSVVDIAGYAKTLQMVVEEKERRAAASE